MIQEDSILGGLNYKDRLDIILSKYLNVTIPCLAMWELYNSENIAGYTLITYIDFKIKTFKLSTVVFPMADKYGRIHLDIQEINKVHYVKLIYKEYQRSWWITE